jgi:hypothetical protein
MKICNWVQSIDLLSRIYYKLKKIEYSCQSSLVQIYIIFFQYFEKNLYYRGDWNKMSLFFKMRFKTKLIRIFKHSLFISHLTSSHWIIFLRDTCWANFAASTQNPARTGAFDKRHRAVVKEQSKRFELYIYI